MNAANSASYDRNMACIDDYEFAIAEGAMWRGSYAKQFENKPKPEINQLFGSINRILGQKQRLEMNAKIISNSDDATDEDADLLQSRWRNDFQSSDGVESINNSDQEAFFSGFGAFKVVAKYEDEESPDKNKQYLCVEPVYSAASSVIFSSSLRKDKADSKQCWQLIRTSRKAIEEEYGADVVSLNSSNDWLDWSTDSSKDLYLAHYYEAVTKSLTIYDFGGGYTITTGDGIKDSNGESISREDLKFIRDNNDHSTIKKKVRRVEYALLSGDRYLIKPSLTPFKRIPIIPQYGYHAVINGIEYYCGEVRKRRDPQMFFNTYYSSLMEIMSAPQVEKPEYAPEQMARHATGRSRANIDNVPYILSDPIKDINDNPVHFGPIGKQMPPQLGSGLAAAGQQLQTSLLGMAGTGQSTVPSNASADAIQQVNERQDDAFQPLMQNSMSSIKAACECWIDGAQMLYFSNERSLRVMGNDGSYSQVKTMQYDMDDNGNYGAFKNSARGKYTVQVKVGESFKDKKSAELDTTLKMLQFADTNSPQGQLLLNQAIISTTGEGGARSRKVASYQIIDNMLALGLDPEAETEEEQQYVQQKLAQQQAAAQQQQSNPQDILMQIEMLKQQTLMLNQQNKAQELQLKTAQAIAKDQGEQAKLQSETALNIANVTQNQQKIDNDARDKFIKNAIAIAELEFKSQQEQNANIQGNMQVMR